MTIEAGSLYEAGVDPDPCDTGDLVSFRVLGHDLVNVDLEENTIRGGCVDENAGEMTPNISDCNVDLPSSECMDSGDPDYAKWVDVGKPKAWCCPYHKDGDMTGDGWINILDVLLIRPPHYNVGYGDPNYDCRADITHDGWCNILDVLVIRPPNYNVAVPGTCQVDWKDDCGPNP
jgi:hypothetical protein